MRCCGRRRRSGGSCGTLRIGCWRRSEVGGGKPSRHWVARTIRWGKCIAV